MKWYVIGLFGRVMNNNVELCSDWLFHSAAHFSSPHSRKETQGGKYIFQYFLSQLHHRVIIQYAGIREPLLKCGALKLLSNARSLFTFTFTFDIRDRTHSVYTMERQYLPNILQGQMLVSGAQDL